ncbi:insulinoma-associated protein 1-like [Nilaparvata lugens]|uniref:insulinoma-associated protein 1-like n=1 Tax=Nilaparvata lugens TaxID=108931 RepID=UPI00193E859E|nr:insulinoma-associated protein 1-like [Nilaparvata lugens]
MPQHGFLARNRLDMSSSAFHPVVPGFWFDPRVYLYADPPPLDLSIKSNHTPITPPSTPSPSTPPRKRTYSEDSADHGGDAAREPVPLVVSHFNDDVVKSPFKKHKAVRKLDFDEDNTSPVSGTIIRQLRDDEPPLVVRKGDIDPAFNVVEVTEEAKAELAKIENRIGDYICRLCKEMYEDAFGLAQHRCSRIVHVEYRCPECDKVFNCPANLASHRRWHRPRQPPAVKRPQEAADGGPGGGDLPCPVCHKLFRRQAYLRKHLATHQQTHATHQSHATSVEWHAHVATGQSATVT